jgi:AcrR family transcriptional regulator
LDAAEAVVVEEGAGRLTLDAVAARAGVSKGGLLYNFSTKEALLEAMIGRLCQRFEEAHALTQARLSEGSAAPLKAYLSVSLDREPGWDHVASALLAAIANNIDLLEPMREHYRRWLPQLAVRSAFPRDAAVWLAAEGLWLLELLGLSPLNQKQRRQVTDYLNALADEDSTQNKRRSRIRRTRNGKSGAG